MIYCKSLQGHRDIPPLGLLPLGLRVLDGSAHSAAWKNSETDFMVNFYHAYSYRGGNYNCFLSHIAHRFPIANNLQELFVHAVLFPDS